jgi:hypothetical protein
MAGTNIPYTDVREFMRFFIIGVYFLLCSIVESVFACQDNLLHFQEGGIGRVILYFECVILQLRYRMTLIRNNINDYELVISFRVPH